jgi:hypothetical protein
MTPKKMIAAARAHIELARAINIRVRGIKIQVVLLVIVEAP